MNLRIITAAAAILVSNSVTAADASLITERVTLDAKSFSFVFGSVAELKFVVPAVTLETGDQFALEARFRSGQSVTETFPGPGALGVIFFGDDPFDPSPAHAHSLYTLSLLGVTGHPAQLAESDECGDCDWGAMDPVTNSTVTFTGISLLDTALEPFSTTGREALIVVHNSSSGGISIISKVPEPGSFLLMFGPWSLILAGRRRAGRAL